MDANNLYLSCSVGIISDIVDVGISAKFESPEYCLRNYTGACANSLNPTLNTTLK